jgi:CHAT domain-containing protein
LNVLHQQNIDTLVWIPDGALRTIPLAALTDGTRYVIDDFAVATAPGLSLVDPRPLASIRTSDTLLVGLSIAAQGFPALPMVQQELSNISLMRPKNEMLLNQSFRVASVNRAFAERDFTVVHVASHGSFDHDPAKSFLLAYDGKITLDTLEDAIKQTNKAQTPPELLVLSDRAALGLAGIAVKSGARSAVASLWTVNDRATAELVAYFYGELVVVGQSKAAALRRAQLALKKDARFRHPAFWSPFLLIGNWL